MSARETGRHEKDPKILRESNCDVRLLMEDSAEWAVENRRDQSSTTGMVVPPERNAGRPSMFPVRLRLARLARRLLIARPEVTPRFAGPPFGTGGRRRANLIVYTDKVARRVPNRLWERLSTPAGSPNKPMKLTDPPPDLGHGTCLGDLQKSLLGAG